MFSKILRISDIINCLVDATTLAEKVEADSDLKPTLHQQKKQHDFEARDESISDPKTKLKVEFFSFINDVATKSIKETFTFLILNNIFKLKSETTNELLDKYKNLETILIHEENRHIIAIEPCNELKVVSKLVP